MLLGIIPIELGCHSCATKYTSELGCVQAAELCIVHSSCRQRTREELLGAVFVVFVGCGRAELRDRGATGKGGRACSQITVSHRTKLVIYSHCACDAQASKQASRSAMVGARRHVYNPQHRARAPQSASRHVATSCCSFNDGKCCFQLVLARHCWCCYCCYCY